MIVKRNRHNTDFQIAYFIAGSCFTADAAYFALLNQRDERQRALTAGQASDLRRQARRIEIDRALLSEDSVEQLRATADDIEWHAEQAQMVELQRACEDELAFIDLCIERVKPLRQYAHLPDNQAVEQCQREEFAKEFQYRIENYMMTSGSIPHNELSSMRQHPDFQTQILPHIQQVQLALSKPNGAENFLPCAVKGFDLPRLLGYTNDNNQ
jgi:hypothetical protein